jgi:hypothetical protein
MRTTPAHDNVFDFNALLHPGTVFTHPRDVVADPKLSLAEKRAILAFVGIRCLGDRLLSRAPRAGRTKGPCSYR